MSWLLSPWWERSAAGPLLALPWSFLADRQGKKKNLSQARCPYYLTLAQKKTVQSRISSTRRALRKAKWQLSLSQMHETNLSDSLECQHPAWPTRPRSFPGLPDEWRSHRQDQEPGASHESGPLGAAESSSRSARSEKILSVKSSQDKGQAILCRPTRESTGRAEGPATTSRTYRLTCLLLWHFHELLVCWTLVGDDQTQQDWLNRSHTAGICQVGQPDCLDH